MTYDQADNILQNRPPEEPGKPLPPPLTAGSPVDVKLIHRLRKDLTILTELARKRRNRREVFGGAVDLSGSESGSELKFTLVDGKPTKVVPKQDKEIHHTIAELMIMANTDVARLIHETFPDSALLRIHRPIEESRLVELKNALESAGVKLTGSDGASLAKSLRVAQQRAKSTNQPFQSLLLSITTRAMTEAQYICTGNLYGHADICHYGLGLREYTHFTSPIRRYCDIVVHKQLLAVLSMRKASKVIQSTKHTMVHLKPLESLPDSETISVLAGEGLRESSFDAGLGEDSVDALIQGAASLALGENWSSVPPQSAVVVHCLQGPYDKAEVSAICERLNLHNRLAKHSSYECQSLFLSLYFKDHSDIAQAIVTNLRENGMLVYVPKFDFKGPIFISDMNGDVQLDPALLGLPSDFGDDLTLGFTNVENQRRIVNGLCRLIDGQDERLEVGIPGRSNQLVIRAFDVVNVSISCENWDVRARVPPPRLHLSARPIGTSAATLSPMSQSLAPMKVPNERPAQHTSQASEDKQRSDGDRYDGASMFELLRNVRRRIPLGPGFNRSPVARNTSFRSEVLKGRVVYGGFTNPDTVSAAKAAAQFAAAEDAAERRAHVSDVSSKRSEFDSSRAIERTVTSRQQRLAGDKRNTRRSKAS
jgi:RNB domain